LAGVSFRAFLGFFEAVGFALDSDDFGAMHESVDERNDARSIGKHVGPCGEGFVCCHERALGFVTPVEQLEE
jgi:hypothetical protein